MLKLVCVTGYKLHDGDPIVNGHQTQEMILEEAKDVSPEFATRLKVAISRCNSLVEDVYRINSVEEAAKEFFETLSAVNSDNVEDALRVDRRFRSYVLEFDMFLDYWQSRIAHYKRINGVEDENIIKKGSGCLTLLTKCEQREASCVEDRSAYNIKKLMMDESIVNFTHVNNKMQIIKEKEHIL